MAPPTPWPELMSKRLDAGQSLRSRKRLGVAVYREGERAEKGEVTLSETAAALNISQMTVLRMIRNGVLPAQQLCKGAPCWQRGRLSRG